MIVEGGNMLVCFCYDLYVINWLIIEVYECYFMFFLKYFNFNLFKFK